MRNYAITMTIRMLCFALAVLITPYSWYTWLFAVGAIFLPYVAVVIANASKPTIPSSLESPTVAIESTATSTVFDSKNVHVISVPEALE